MTVLLLVVLALFPPWRSYLIECGDRRAALDVRYAPIWARPYLNICQVVAWDRLVLSWVAVAGLGGGLLIFLGGKRSD